MRRRGGVLKSELDTIYRPYAFITCIYVSISLLLLLQFDRLNDIGKYEMYPFITLLGILEIAKYLHSARKGPKTRIKTQNIIYGLFIFAISIVVFYLGTILMGAEVSGQFEGTVMFSFLLSVLTILPVNLYLGSNYVPQLIFKRYYEDNVAGVFVIQNTLGVFLGAWLGSFPIPLDWDRPWQVWPITCSTGALCGFLLSNFLTCVGFPNYVGRKILSSRYGLNY